MGNLVWSFSRWHIKTFLIITIESRNKNKKINKASTNITLKATGIWQHEVSHGAMTLYNNNKNNWKSGILLQKGFKRTTGYSENLKINNTVSNSIENDNTLFLQS